MIKSKRYCKQLVCFFYLILSSSIFADEELIHDIEVPKTFSPWFTGPLITTSGYTLKPGHYNIEPYLFFTVNTGNYDEDWHVSSIPNFYTTRLQIQTKIGIVNGLDFQFFPQVYYRATQGEHAINIGDLPIGLNIQLLMAQLKDPWPAIKLSLKANIPIGKYQHLNPSRKRTDVTGNGSWLPGAALVFGKLFELSEFHYLETRLAFTYQVGTPVHVKGSNFYGGASNTDGTAYHGNIFLINGAVQYNFTQEWVFACDLQYHHNNNNRFSGFAGTDFDGDAASVTHPSSEQWSIAPAIEYNWSKNIGVIGGVWFSFAGRNTSQFVSGVVALNIHI